MINDDDAILTNQQEELFQRTKADTKLADVTVLNEFKGDIVSGIEEALGLVKKRTNKIGACIILLQAIADPTPIEVAGAVLDTEFTFRVLEDPVTNSGANGTGIRALTICRRLVRIHHFYQARGMMGIVEAKKPCIVPVTDQFAPVAYEVRFTSSEESFDPNLKVATPAIAPGGGVVPQAVTLSCVTAGAQIYYTVDGSHPWSGNPTALLYAAPINVVAAATLRAGAFKAGMVASNINAEAFTN